MFMASNTAIKVSSVIIAAVTQSAPKNVWVCADVGLLVRVGWGFEVSFVGL
jgi:hypothetical protein